MNRESRRGGAQQSIDTICEIKVLGVVVYGRVIAVRILQEVPFVRNYQLGLECRIQTCSRFLQVCLLALLGGTWDAG